MIFLVIGLGSIGTRHAKNLVDMGHTVFSYDIATYSEEPKIKPARLRDEVDAWIICTPTIDHMTYLIEATNRKRHIFVEKPIAEASHATLDGVLRDAKRDNLVVMVGNMLRFHPNVMMAKSLIKKPTKAIFQVLQKNKHYKDHVILNWGAHEIDLALYLFGPAKVRDAIGTNKRASVTLEHDSGTVSIINMDYLTEPEVRRFEVDEEDMTHEVNLTLHDWNPIYMAEMEAFIGLIEGKLDPRCATGEDGLAVLRLIEKAKEIARPS